jgi:hypothetical protein
VAEIFEGLRTFFEIVDFWGRFWGGEGMAASPPEDDEPDSNKSSAQVGAQAATPLPVEVEDFFPLTIFTFTYEVFSEMLSPQDCVTNFLLHFRGLANNRSCAEV